MLRPLSNKEMKEKECYWYCKAYRRGEGVGDNFCSLSKKDCLKRKGKIK